MRFKNLLLAIDENPIEGFIIDNIYFLVPIILGLVIVFLSNKYFFNFKAKCPNCGATSDLSRIKKNEWFKRFKLTEKIKKYNCRKCHYKFYILKNAPKGKDKESDKF